VFGNAEAAVESEPGEKEGREGGDQGNDPDEDDPGRGWVDGSEASIIFNDIETIVLGDDIYVRC